jgi:hypothetical protein
MKAKITNCLSDCPIAAFVSTRISRCRGCGAPIRWLRTPNGKNMPVDAAPVEWAEHLTELLVHESGIAVRVGACKPIEVVHGLFYRPHWASCPAADKFKRK